MAETIMGPVHPGEILLEEFLRPLSVSQYRLAKEIGVPVRRVNEIVHGQRRISADTALRLARFFGTSKRFWINLQSRYELEMERTVGGGRELVPYRRPRAATCSVPGRRLMAGCAHQQPSYGAHGAVPSSAYAVANTWFCSAADAFPKSAGLPPAATQAE